MAHNYSGYFAIVLPVIMKCSKMITVFHFWKCLEEKNYFLTVPYILLKSNQMLIVLSFFNYKQVFRTVYACV